MSGEQEARNQKSGVAGVQELQNEKTDFGLLDGLPVSHSARQTIQRHNPPEYPAFLPAKI